MNRKDKFKKTIKDGLIVSCQALEHEPMYRDEGHVMPLFAKAAMLGGAVAIRANSVRDIMQIKQLVNLPVIGLIKKSYPPYEQHITVTMDEIDELVKADTDVVALDCTLRERPDGLSPAQFVSAIKKKYPSVLLMADIATFEDVLHICDSGVDFIGTTLSGYTSNSISNKEPDFELVKKIVKHCEVPVIAEGRIHYPEQAKKMLEIGAFSVVVGGAITRPMEITERFVKSINNVEKNEI